VRWFNFNNSQRDLFTSRQGSSLVEIVIATGVMALVLTAIVSGLTLSLQTNAESEYRSQAIKRAQEAMEVFRRERTLLGWDLFYSSFTDEATYCLQTLPEPKSTFTEGACDATDSMVISGLDFYREAVVDIDNSDPNNPTIGVTVTVTWSLGENSRNVEFQQVFRQWN
jgi:type II secretory pathway pseudopilin PulG